MKRYLIAIAILFILTSPVIASTFLSNDPMDTFRDLVKRDKGLSLQEKEQWIFLASRQLQGTRFSFDYGRIVYQIFSQAKFDEVDMERASRVAYNSVMAVERGGPEKEVVDLALFAFSIDLSPEEIGLYAETTQKNNIAGVPLHVTQEMIRGAKEESWDEFTFSTMMNGLIKAAAERLDVEKVALYMLISVAQGLGTPDQIVRDALVDARKRKGTTVPKGKTKKEPATKTPAIPRVALNYDRFKASIESFLGTPYLWGGNTRRGVDCSGFTVLVMKENGYSIPRVSREQARVGTSVYKDDLGLGDLLFFDTRGVGRVTHVGIYLGGNLLVHASSSKGVTLVLFSDRYFRSRFLSARRIVRY
ncbi:MAG: C40 family peptidase [Syntrophaceae bacterium]|nr:C40 family peptidase [Syntrophaceae bacterium]